MIDLRPFQRRFVKAVESDRYDTLALSTPRSQGKTTLVGHMAARMLTPGDPLFAGEGKRIIVVAGTLEQGIPVLEAACEELGGLAALKEDKKNWSVANSLTRVHLYYKPTDTRLRVIGANGRAAMGFVNIPYVIADEPGAWKPIDGRLMHSAIQTAMAKPGSPLKAIYVGTLAPALMGWWHDLVDGGTLGRTYVQLLRADPEKWDKASEIRRVSALNWYFPDTRRKIFEERDDARTNSGKRSDFFSYYLNLPRPDEASELLPSSHWTEALSRYVQGREGKPIVGIDLGGGRAWSAAVAIWPSGRTEALALAPGIPSLEDQARRDRMPLHLYEKLHDRGLLIVDNGMNKQRPEVLIREIEDRWGEPFGIIADRFALPDLKDCIDGIPLELRKMMPSECIQDIRAIQKFVADGPLNVCPESAALLTVSLSVCTVHWDLMGNGRIEKHRNNRARDDVAAALVLAAGACDRYRYFEREAEEETEDIGVLSF